MRLNTNKTGKEVGEIRMRPVRTSTRKLGESTGPQQVSHSRFSSCALRAQALRPLRHSVRAGETHQTAGAPCRLDPEAQTVQARTPLLWVALVCGLALGVATAATARDCESSGERISFLAVGDTGMLGPAPGQVVVGRALARLDRHHPADALVFLGDNFYPDGLHDDTLVARLRDNLVRPYCRFLSPTGRRWSEVSDACDGGLPKHAIPIFAVLGNHDLKRRGSASLERNAIPKFVANWRMPEGVAQAYELGCGVSIVAFDSTTFRKGATSQPLVEALRSSSGPWRILVAHHPLATVRREKHDGQKRHHEYRQRVLDAIDAAGVRVQLMIAGHDHYLAAGPAGGDSFLNVIAGAGAASRSQPLPRHGVAFRSSELGFARVSITEFDGEPVLRVALWAAGSNAADPLILARWRSISRGQLRRRAPTRAYGRTIWRCARRCLPIPENVLGTQSLERVNSGQAATSSTSRVSARREDGALAGAARQRLFRGGSAPRR